MSDYIVRILCHNLFQSSFFKFYFLVCIANAVFISNDYFRHLRILQQMFFVVFVLSKEKSGNVIYSSFRNGAGGDHSGKESDTYLIQQPLL